MIPDSGSVLADTSVWIDHLRRGDEVLAALLDGAQVLMHSFVIGEIACGILDDRTVVLQLLAHLPQAATATEAEALAFIESRQIMGRGVGYVDVHLLASAILSDVPIWTRDRRLAVVARGLGIAFDEPGAPPPAARA